MNYNIFCMCGLDYESILNTHKKEENKKYIEDLHRQKENTITKTSSNALDFVIEFTISFIRYLASLASI